MGDNDNETLESQVDGSVDEEQDGQGIDLVAAAGVAPVAPKISTELQATSDDRAIQRGRRTLTKARLDAEPKVSLYIPEGQPEIAKINGVRFEMPAGEETLVPQSVARLVQAKWRATAQSNKPRQLDLGTM